MITNTDKSDIFAMFIFCLGFLIMLLAIISLKDDTRKLKTEVDELRLLFNQKFLQEMIIEKPNIRDFGSTTNLARFEI